MSLNAYIQKENGDLRNIAETEDEISAEQFIELLIEDTPRFAKEEAFVILDDEAGTMQIVENIEEEVTEIRRVIRVAGSDNGAVVTDEEETPKPRRRTAKRKASGKGSNSVQAAAKRNREEVTAKAKARKPAARRTGSANAKGTSKPAVRRRGSSFKRNPASDE